VADESETPPGAGGAPTTGRFGRALKLSGLATRVTGSVIAHSVKRAFGGGSSDPDHHAGSAALLANAERIVKTMGEMKGAAMKVGQLLSADPDLIHPDFADRLSSLQRNAPPMTFDMVRSQIEAAFGRPIGQLYAEFEPEPIGAASIGQVHRARLHGGRVVAVKVQYPGITATLDSDLRNLGAVLSMGRVFLSRERLDQFIEEARGAILDEADYELEARTLAKFRRLLAHRPGLRVPEPFPEYTARTVVTMEYIAGGKLDEVLLTLDDQAEKDRLITRFVETFVWMFHEHYVLHADPHPGNFLLDEQHNIVLLDFGCVKDFDPELCDGVLYLLRHFWEGDMHALEQRFRLMGFGTPDAKFPDHEVLRAYHDLILAPIKHDAPFDFDGWSVHARLRTFLRENFELIRMIPPAGLILYFRVLAGLKGQMTRMKANINLRAIAEEQCRRKGVM
jgi:predicted unusual protein kinase regulating ubiquinone biosynthesis (AarF/ABC1/UbiB family)